MLQFTHFCRNLLGKKSCCAEISKLLGLWTSHPPVSGIGQEGKCHIFTQTLLVVGPFNRSKDPWCAGSMLVRWFAHGFPYLYSKATQLLSWGRGDLVNGVIYFPA